LIFCWELKWFDIVGKLPWQRSKLIMPLGSVHWLSNNNNYYATLYLHSTLYKMHSNILCTLDFWNKPVRWAEKIKLFWFFWYGKPGIQRSHTPIEIHISSFIVRYFSHHTGFLRQIRDKFIFNTKW
jgi:hypothetical protein